MARTNAEGRLNRIELLAAQLGQDDHATVADLARQFGVSPRTIARDLSLMRDRGMQIDADRGRGGGVRLDRNWSVGRINLAYADAVDLLISIAVAEQMNSPMFLANLGAVRRQLVASFSPEKRKRVNRIKSRILVGVTASTYVQAGVGAPSKRIVQSLHRAFIDQEVLEIRYRREDGQTSVRRIEPHYLLLKYPVWYVVAFDQTRQEPRTFRVDRILAANGEGTHFTLRPKERFQPSLVADGLLI